MSRKTFSIGVSALAASAIMGAINLYMATCFSNDFFTLKLFRKVDVAAVLLEKDPTTSDPQIRLEIGMVIFLMLNNAGVSDIYD